MALSHNAILEKVRFVSFAKIELQNEKHYLCENRLIFSITKSIKVHG